MAERALTTKEGGGERRGRSRVKLIAAVAVWCALVAVGVVLVRTFVRNPRADSGPPTLLQMAREGDTREMARALRQGADPNEASHVGFTPLHWAAYRGDIQMMDLLLDHGADVNAQTEDVWAPPDVGVPDHFESPLKTPLFAAAAGGQAEAARLLLDRGARLDVLDRSGWTALHRAAAEGETGVARILLDRGVDVNATSKTGETPLHWAVRRHGEHHWYSFFYANDPLREVVVDSTPVIELLLAKGADINATDEKGWTPLHWATIGGHRAIAALLVEHGADITATMKEAQQTHYQVGLLVQGAPGQGVLHLAAAADDAKLAEMFLDRGVPVHVKDDAGLTPFDEACRTGSVETARLLLKRGADPQLADADGWLPIHYAAWSGNAELLALLLDLGAPVNAKTPSAKRLPPRRTWWDDEPAGVTPLHLAAHAKSAAAVRLLIARGAGVNAQDGQGWTPLHWVVYCGAYEIGEMLLDSGADGTIRNRDGRTPLDMLDRYEKDFRKRLEEAAEAAAAPAPSQQSR